MKPKSSEKEVIFNEYSTMLNIYFWVKENKRLPKSNDFSEEIISEDNTKMSVSDAIKLVEDNNDNKNDKNFNMLESAMHRFILKMRVKYIDNTQYTNTNNAKIKEIIEMLNDLEKYKKQNKKIINNNAKYNNIDELIKNIIENIPEDASIASENSTEDIKEKRYIKLKRARYLYLALCSNLHYDINYVLGDENYKKKLFNEHSNNTTGVCNTFSILGKKLFKKAGIDAIALDVDKNEYKGNSYNEPEHIFFAFTLDERDQLDNKKYYLADPSFDLKRVQIGCKTKYFGSKPTTTKNEKGYPNNLSIIDDTVLKKIDCELGYIKNDYSDKLINDLKFKVLNNKSNRDGYTLKDSIQEVLLTLDSEIFSKNRKIEIYDLRSSYKMIFHKIFPDEMKNGIINFDFKKIENQKNEKTVIVSLRQENGEIIEYFYNPKYHTWVLKNKMPIKQKEER